jgi:hypothetical protein
MQTRQAWKKPGLFCSLNLTTPVRSIKANPPKGGDAKLWIYRCVEHNYDRQAAENEYLVLYDRTETLSLAMDLDAFVE